MQIQFRNIEYDDLQHVCELATTPEDLLLIFPSASYPLTIPQLQEKIGDRWSPTVMLADGVISGFANLYYLKQGGTAFIGNLIIAAHLRGHGLGTQLIRHMLDIGRTKYQLQEMRISVFNTNTPALALYGALGFVPFAMEPRLLGGHRVSLLHLRLPLQS